MAPRRAFRDAIRCVRRPRMKKEAAKKFLDRKRTPSPSSHHRARIVCRGRTPRFLPKRRVGAKTKLPPPRQPPATTAGCRAFTPELRSIAWPGKFKPDLPPRYDGTADPATL